ncbi:Type III effector HopPtoA1Pma [Pseudomonas syringae pv. philadelphi]|uniref:Type III effector HopPtoA1Pma n=1 Tax=Pseudomonas syringae pv. philadelphi TaxID=251706 RepID=A0A3M3Z6Z2_9PSED|nr:type III effector [Pseudomonas syringae group genomosp. 3]RMO89999.1 Type III effector HopPtoA1Pma [Pseudomonas syringae pv. philadelphi]
MNINRSISSQSSISTESFHSAHETVASSSVRVLSEAEQTKLNDITRYLNDHVFAAHRLPVDDINADQDVVHAHNVEIGKIISARAIRLLDEGETALSIGETFAKAEKFDRMATAASGALRATPFAAASVLQYMQPAINKGDWLPTPLKPLAPLVSGALSGVMDQVGTGVMNRATGDLHYLSTAPEKLHDVMAASVKRHAPGVMRQAADLGIAVQTYTVRNALRTVLAPALASKPAVQGAVDISVSAAGGLVANAGFSERMHTVQARDHLRGGAFVLGIKDKQPKTDLSEETDWLDAYRAIKSASYSGAALNAGKRVAGLPLDVATDGLKAVRSLVSATSLMQNGLVMAGGFAGVGKLQEMATKNITHPATKAAVSQLTNLAGSAPVFAGWTTAAVATDPAVKKAESFLQDTVKTTVSNGTSALADKTVKLAKAGIDASAERIATTGASLRDTLRRRTVREPDIEEGGVAAGTGSPGAVPFEAMRS